MIKIAKVEGLTVEQIKDCLRFLGSKFVFCVRDIDDFIGECAVDGIMSYRYPPRFGHDDVKIVSFPEYVGVLVKPHFHKRDGKWYVMRTYVQCGVLRRVVNLWPQG